tara:strand:- start:5243 stop:5581 length:339 start_codon:yes stop_codon:yes gene_type:complete
MKNIKKNLAIILLYVLLISILIYLNKNKFLNLISKINNNKFYSKKTILSKNFIDLNKAVYSNQEYKKNIVFNYISEPSRNSNGFRVNFFNSNVDNDICIKRDIIIPYLNGIY